MTATVVRSWYPWLVGLSVLYLLSGCGSPQRKASSADNAEMAHEYGNNRSSIDDGDAERMDEARAESDREDDSRVRRAPAGMPFSDTENLAPRVRRRYSGERRVNADNFFDGAPNEGSLWVLDGQGNYYFTKNRNRAVGDLVTVVLEEPSIRETLAEVKRTLTSAERKMELSFAQERIKAKVLGDPEPAIVPVPGSSFVAKTDKDGKKEDRAPAAVAAAPSPTPSPQASLTPEAAIAKQKEIEQQRREKVAKMAKATMGDVDIVPYVGLKASDTMLAEIVDRYPNGNFKIRGTKKVPYRSGYRLVTLLGVVRGSDINESNDTVLSGKLYEYRLTVLR